MVEGSCHCGTVRIALEAAPEDVTDCNCSICRRYGTLWAYYRPAQVRIAEDVPTQSYLWGERAIEFHRCAVCGCVTHWSATKPGRDRMGVNARLLKPDVLAAAKVRKTDGASWQGKTF